MKYITLLLGLLITSNITAQTVTTFADGTPDDAIAVDSNGNIYCSNYVGDTVFKFTPAGDVSSFITGLNTPNGLAFNSNEELYVCDGAANTIYKYDLNGVLLDTYPAAGHPSGIIKSFDSDTMIFSEYQGNKINTLAPDGTISELSLAGELNGPVGLCYDELGELYVGNYNNREIYRVLSNGDVQYVAQLPTDGAPFPNLGFISFAQGMIWGTTMGSDKIYAVNPSGIDDFYLFAGSDQGSMDGDISVATFHTPNGIAFGENGNTMYITDFGTKNLRIISNVVVLGIEEELSKSIQVKLYPNPTGDTLYIATNIQPEILYDIKIINQVGQLVVESNSVLVRNSEHISLDISQLNTGIYNVEIISEESKSSKKFVKK